MSASDHHRHMQTYMNTHTHIHTKLGEERNRTGETATHNKLWDTSSLLLVYRKLPYSWFTTVLVTSKVKLAFQEVIIS